MIIHYLKLATRDLLKNKYYTCINVFGLVFGMLSALIIAKYIGGSLQFDSFHLLKDRIHYLTQQESTDGNEVKRSHSTYWGVGELLDQYPEVANATRYGYHVESMIIADGEAGHSVSFFENKIFSVDSGFFDIFTFPLINGDPSTALSRPNSIVLSRSASQRYFGDRNPVGKTLTLRAPWGWDTMYEITGVVSDIPPRSQFDFDFLLTQNPLAPEEFWYVPDYSTFLLLKEGVDTRSLSGKLTNALSAVPQLKSTNRKVVMEMESLAVVHLSTTEYLLLATGIFIILISWVNYINQVIAQSYWRMKEIGVLRVMGATRANLKAQFVVESALICLSSLIIVVVLYGAVEPFLQSLTDGHLLPLLHDPTPLNFVFLFIFLTGVVLAAAIPSVIFFSQNSGAVLRSNYTANIGGIGLRKVLVVVQFSISTILIVSVFVISGQLDYMTRKDKGMDMENVLIIQAPVVKDTSWNVKRKTVELFKNNCAELPFVTAVASSTSVPGEEYRWETYLSLEDNNTKSLVHQTGVDAHFLDLYHVTFLAGRNFNANAMWKNRNSVILNESAAGALGIVDYEKMINAKITDHESGEVYELAGIINDYHQTSLKYKMRPIAFKFNATRGHFSLKIGDDASTEEEWEDRVRAIKEIWARTYPDASFEYFFLDEKFAAQDRDDYYVGRLFNYFTILSIVISCLGLFGLSLLISTKRQREIGVRKVFGATPVSILATLVKGYLAPLAMAVIIGAPVAYFLMSMWLSNFAYRIEIGLDMMATALAGLTLIFLLTIAYQTIKSSITNPVKALRD